LVSGNPLEQRPELRHRAAVRVVLVDLVDLVVRAGAAEVGLVAAVVDVAALAVGALAVALAVEGAARANGTILPSVSRYSTSSTTLTCRRRMEL